jgi:alpha-mannosidase
MNSQSFKPFIIALLGAATLTAADAQTRDVSKGKNLYTIGYAHLDTQWRWAYPQVIREFIWNTLTRNFELMDKYPDYVFNFSGSRRYEMMKEYYPDAFTKLKGYVAKGQWFPCGSSVDEGDANVPSAESLVRHVLYGNRFFRREFGVASQEFMLPDCFGFPYALPTVLAYCGIKGFSTQKLTWGSAVGIPFPVGVWEGPDGKSVVAALDPGSYSADVTEDLSQNSSWLARIDKTGAQSGAFVDYHYYGTGDVGGSPSESSVQWVEKSIAGKGPVTIISSHADQMVKDLKPAQIAKMPRYKGELLLTQHSAGSVSSEAMMKRWNRKNELLADGAEKASVAAMALGRADYPAERLYNAWDLVLGSQMHDMLPGTSIPKAYEFCWNDELLALNQFSNIEADAVGAVSKDLDTSGAGQAIVIYNPLSTVRDDVVEADLPGVAVLQHTIIAPDGKEVPAQVVPQAGGGSRVLFRAHVPSTGFAVYIDRPLPSRQSPVQGATASERTLESSTLKVTVNEAGDIASIYDKFAKREVLKAPARLELQYHNPSAFPAWNMDWDDQKQPPREVVSGPARIRVIEQGPVRAAIEVERECAGSKFVQQIRLTQGSNRVEVLNKLDWQTRERALKASFPLSSGNPLATYDLQVGAIQRPNNEPKKYEVPQHQWLDLTDPKGGYGAAILNDSKYGSDKPDDNTVRLTLIYTPGVRAGYEDQATQDFGKHEILYAIAPHGSDWRSASVPWQAKRLNQPLRPFLAPSHPGALGRYFSLVSTNSPQVEVQAVKKAEDGNELVVRLRELNGSEAKGVQVRFGLPLQSAREVNGQEQPIGKATVANGLLTTDLHAFSLRSFAVKLAGAKSSGGGPVSQPVVLDFNADVVSSRQAPGDGEFAAGHSLAAEQWPSALTVDGVHFNLGSGADGAKNAVRCEGQPINLPAGFNKAYLLAAADTDLTASFSVGDSHSDLAVQNWSGYVGQWDNRLWSVDPGPNFSNYGDTMNGLVPGYVKRGEVAWFASHNHTPTGNTFYEYSYLFKQSLDIPAGATTLTLPNEPRIKIFAVTVARNANDVAQPAQALYDTLSDHVGGGAPSISPSEGSFSDVTTVKITPPLYWSAGSIHYTTDGSTPTASSPVYTGPFTLNDPATVKVAQLDSSGMPGPVASAHLEVRDTTAPSVIAASVVNELGIAKLVFSEPVSKESAESPAHYHFAEDDAVTSARLNPDGRTVEVILAHPLSNQPQKVSVNGVADLAAQPNLTNATVDAIHRGAVFSSPAADPKTARSYSSIKGLPVKSEDSFTLNLFCRVDQQPEDLTVIAGFGRASDGRTGTGRYFTKFTEGINFWVSNRDVGTNVPLDLRKWQMLTATYDGETMRLYKNGMPIAEQKVHLEKDIEQVRIMPLDAWDHKRRFGGEVRDLTVWDIDLPPAAVKRMWDTGNKQ